MIVVVVRKLNHVESEKEIATRTHIVRVVCYVETTIVTQTELVLPLKQIAAI